MSHARGALQIFDDGVNYNHPDLSNHLWDGSNMYYDANQNGIDEPWEKLEHHGWDFVDAGPYGYGDNDPGNGGGHGTLVAGCVGGDGTGQPGDQKITGVAPKAILLFVRCYSSEGNMMKAFHFILDTKLRYGSNFNPRIITMSVSIKFPSIPKYDDWRDLTNNIYNANIIHTNSIGDQGDQGGQYPVPYNIPAPANVPPAWLHPDQPMPKNTSKPHVSSVIACGATDQSDQVWSYSGIGPSAWENIKQHHPEQDPIDTSYWDYLYETAPPGQENPLIKPDVTGPSGSLDLETQTFYSTSVDGHYSHFGGTSASTPFVAGVAALILNANNSLSNIDVSRVLQQTAYNISSPGHKTNNYGAGRVAILIVFLISLLWTQEAPNYGVKRSVMHIQVPICSQGVLLMRMNLN